MEIERRNKGRPLKAAGWPERTFLAGLDEATRDALFRLGSLRQYAVGSTLLMEGDTAPDVAVIVDGWAKVVGSTWDGGKALLALLIGGDLAGEQAALENTAMSTSVISAGPVVARTIARHDFLSFLGARPDANLEVSRALSAKLSWATRRRIDFSGLSVLVRLARVLNELALVDGRLTGSTIELRYSLTQPEFAAMVGASEPSVHKALRQLKAEGVIETGYRRIQILDPRLLESVACSGWIGDKLNPRALTPV
jgi:CRP/FNR family transcriptional regulator, cyclic AMP receptor protein